MLAPIRLPISPPTAAPARPAAMCSPVPPPNWDPIRPPATAPRRVPVFSFAPCPVSGVAAQAAIEVATITAPLRRTKRMPPPFGLDYRQRLGQLIAQITAKLWRSERPPATWIETPPPSVHFVLPRARPYSSGS